MPSSNTSYLPVEEFEQLMERYKGGDKTALEPMVEDMQNLITWEINKFGARYAAYFGKMQLRQNLNSFLMDKIHKYKKIEGGSFIKYFTFCLKKHFIDLRRELNATLSERENTKSFENFWRDDERDQSLDKTYVASGFSEDSILDKMEIENIKNNILPLIPKNYREVAELYYFNHYTVNKITSILHLAKSTVDYRLKMANEEIAKIISAGKTRARTNAPDKTQANRLERIDPLLKEAIKTLDIEAEFMPLLTDRQKIIFRDNILNYKGISRSEIMAKSGCKKVSEFAADNEAICNKLKYAIYKKGIIAEFMQRFSSVEECNEITKILSDRQNILLNNYVLSLDYFAESKTAKLLGITVNAVPNLAKALKNQIDYVLMRKKMAEEFVSMNYGEEFLLQVFGKTLPPKHFKVLQGYMMDYHYLSQEDFNRQIGAGRNYAYQAENLIIKKLDEFYKTFNISDAGQAGTTLPAPTVAVQDVQTFGE